MYTHTGPLADMLDDAGDPLTLFSSDLGMGTDFLPLEITLHGTPSKNVDVEIRIHVNLDDTRHGAIPHGYRADAHSTAYPRGIWLNDAGNAAVQNALRGVLSRAGVDADHVAGTAVEDYDGDTPTADIVLYTDSDGATPFDDVFAQVWRWICEVNNATRPTSTTSEYVWALLAK